MKNRRLGTQLEDYLNVPSLEEMVQFMNTKEEDEPFLTAVAKVIDSYGLVSFSPLYAYSVELISRLMFEAEEAVHTL